VIARSPSTASCSIRWASSHSCRARDGGDVCFVVFDVLAYHRTDLRSRPYMRRRAVLEVMLRGGSVPAGLVLTPMSTEHAVAAAWLANHQDAGIEGVVAKWTTQPYRAGHRGWRKIRTRLTGEAVVGGVLGTVCGPQALVLGRFDGGGRLRVAGCTRPLTAAAAREVARLLVPSIHGHPWPATIPSSRFGKWPRGPNTLTLYRGYVRNHISPLLGHLKLSQLDAEILDSFYAELRRCREHCSGRRRTDHRTAGPHDCDYRCGLHLCRPLSPTTVRHMHFILSGAFKRAVRWRWVSISPLGQAEPPAAPKPNPEPPSPAEAARILNAARWPLPRTRPLRTTRGDEAASEAADDEPCGEDDTPGSWRTNLIAEANAAWKASLGLRGLDLLRRHPEGHNLHSHH
jgi:hypothetical protein